MYTHLDEMSDYTGYTRLWLHSNISSCENHGQVAYTLKDNNCNMVRICPPLISHKETNNGAIA